MDKLIQAMCEGSALWLLLGGFVLILCAGAWLSRAVSASEQEYFDNIRSDNKEYKEE